MKLPSETKRPRRWRLLLLLIVCALGAVAVPVTVLSVLWITDSPIVAKVHARQIQARNQFTSSSSTSHSGSARFACRDVAVLNLSDHPLLEEVGAGLLARLEESSYIDHIEYHPYGSIPQKGARAPGIVITLEMASIVESTRLLLQSELDATIRVTAGSGLAGSSYQVSDTFSPPIVDFYWQGTLHHQSTTTGVGSSGTKYRLAAEDIVKQIAGALAKQFDAWHEKYGSLPALPDVFYPPYRDPKPLPLLDAFDTRQITAYHGLMNHNETFWRLTADEPPVDVITEAQRLMETAGWKTAHLGAKNYERPNLRMEKETTVLEVFVGTNSTPGPQTVVAAAENLPQPPSTLYVRYLDRMTAAELDDALQKTLAEDVSAEVLLLLTDMCRKEPLRRLALQKLESRRPATPRAWMTLANLHRGLGHDDDAREALLRAHVLLGTVGNQGDLLNQIQRMAKRLDAEELIEQPIDSAMLQRMGFVRLGPHVDLPEVELTLDRPAHFFARTSDGKLKTISLRVVKNVSDKSKASYQIAHVTSLGSMRSWGKGGSFDQLGAAHHSAVIDGAYRVDFQVVKLAGLRRFHLSVEVFPIVPPAEEDS